MSTPAAGACERVPAGPGGDAAWLRERMLPELPQAMSEHIDRVVALAREFAALHALPEARVSLAGQGHDLLRAVPPQELLRRAERRGLPLLDVERERPVVLHGVLGALELSERFGVSDRGVLDAVRWHTTGHPTYPDWAWAMFVADKVEPAKAEKWPALREVEAEARRPRPGALRDAAARYLRLSLARQREQGEPVHPVAVETLSVLEGAVGSGPPP
ncbi:MAG: bis(5'-nucleosyl)-tetraphosphatase (symmetrical) YqeK [Chloroflexi bacterium]|nr:bis(5'-nucleosyl)-tetraphosphatase (symmetrical) YqeK [Chloroflexota bacterium]